MVFMRQTDIWKLFASTQIQKRYLETVIRAGPVRANMYLKDKNFQDLHFQVKNFAIDTL